MIHDKYKKYKVIAVLAVLVFLYADGYGYAQTQQKITMRGSVFEQPSVTKRILSGMEFVDTSAYSDGDEITVDLHAYGLGGGDTVDPTKSVIIVQGGVAGVWITDKGSTYFKWKSHDISTGDWYWSWQLIEFN